MSVALETVNPQEPAESVSVQHTEMTREPESISADVADPEAANDGVDRYAATPGTEEARQTQKGSRSSKSGTKAPCQKSCCPSCTTAAGIVRRGTIQPE